MNSNRTKQEYVALTQPDSPRGDFLLLGYTLLLSPAERGILRGCLDGSDAGRLPKSGMLRTLLARINRKACSISGRSLLEEKPEGCGLRLFL